jgi:hypothetical protein
LFAAISRRRTAPASDSSGIPDLSAVSAGLSGADVVRSCTSSRHAFPRSALCWIVDLNPLRQGSIMIGRPDICHVALPAPLRAGGRHVPFTSLHPRLLPPLDATPAGHDIRLVGDPAALLRPVRAIAVFSGYGVSDRPPASSAEEVECG